MGDPVSLLIKTVGSLYCQVDLLSHELVVTTDSKAENVIILRKKDKMLLRSKIKSALIKSCLNISEDSSISLSKKLFKKIDKEVLA